MSSQSVQHVSDKLNCRGFIPDIYDEVDDKMTKPVKLKWVLQGRERVDGDRRAVLQCLLQAARHGGPGGGGGTPQLLPGVQPALSSVRTDCRQEGRLSSDVEFPIKLSLLILHDDNLHSLSKTGLLRE